MCDSIVGDEHYCEGEDKVILFIISSQLNVVCSKMDNIFIW